jgi:hypothetical protein
MSDSESLPLSEITLANLEPQVGTIFRWNSEDGAPTELELTEAALIPTKMVIQEGMRPPFSLLFKLPAAEPPAQGLYPLEHKTLGKLEIFLVPVGQVDGGFQMEAVFN